MNHDVDYNVSTYEKLDDLNQQVDDLRINALANLEELHQTLERNRTLAQDNNWKVDTLLSQLETIINTLRKDI